MYELATGLAERGVPCDLMFAASHGAGRTVQLAEGLRLLTCRTWCKVAATMIAPSMIALLRREAEHYDVVHIHHPDPMAALALLLSGYRGRVVLHWHSDITKQKFLLRFYSPLQSWLISRADVIVGTTPVYVEHSPFLQHVKSKLTALPIGIDPIKPHAEAAARIRQQYAGRKIVFSLGRLVAYKGYEYLIEAARYLPTDFVVLIGGSGALSFDLEAAIDTYGVEDRVKLLGRISDEELPAYYGACTLFCLSSVQKTEAFGIVQIEAMSCGKPVVSTTIPDSGTAWVNAHGESGLNVEPRCARALAEAICAVTADEPTYRRYCEGARQRYEKLFTKQTMIDNLLEIYEKLWTERS